MKMNRRHFLPFAGSLVATAVLAACGGGKIKFIENTNAAPLSGSGTANASAAPPTPPRQCLATSDITLTGPSGGLERSLSGVFTVRYTGTLTGTIKVTPSDGAGGQFWNTQVADGTAPGYVYLSQSNPTATFLYAPASSGAKTITLANDGGCTNPVAGHTYMAAAEAPGSATPFRLTRGALTIGSYATLQQCKDIGGYRSGDVIKATGGTYVVYNATDPGATWLVNNSGGVQIGVDVDTLKIEWETPGVPMVLDFSRACLAGMTSGGQPRLLTMGPSCRNLTVRGLHFRGARPPVGADWFGAAFWTQLSGAAGNATLTVEYCKISEFPDGIKTQDGRYDLSTYIRFCVFEDNSDNRGLDHDIYTGRGALTHVEGCTFRKTAKNYFTQLGMGHFVKSRCRATNVVANLFDGYRTADGYGGVAQTVNTPNGGVVSITGNVFLHYGALSSDGKGEPLRYGEGQYYANADISNDPLLTTHSLLFAQNTVRQALGRAADGSVVRVLNIYPTGVATTLLNGSGALTPVTVTVRNNLVANDSPGMAEFMTAYPDNSQVMQANISNLGYLAGGVIAGSPAVNDAKLDYVGEYMPPAARTDTNRGGRVTSIPAWVPSAAWVWTDIPGTVWTDYLKSDGSGIAPAITALDPGPSLSYTSTWEYSGPCYSRKNHELWMFGGGHAATTINILTRYNLHQASPNVSVVSQATPEQDRRDRSFGGHLLDAPYFPTDGKPYSPHSYTNNIYVDGRDEFMGFGVANIATTSDGVTMQAGASSFRDIVAFPRDGAWRAKGYYPNLPTLMDSADIIKGPRALSADGNSIYYWGDGYGMYRFTFGQGGATHTFVGGTTSAPSGMLANNSVDVTLHIVPDSGAGWGVKTCNLATGAQTAITVSGYSIPVGLYCYGVQWVPSIGKYVAMWINADAYNNGANRAATNLTTVLLTTLELTSATTATATLVSMTGTAPTKCMSFRGFYYDDTYDCLIVVTAPNKPVQAIKVA